VQQRSNVYAIDHRRTNASIYNPSNSHGSRVATRAPDPGNLEESGLRLRPGLDADPVRGRHATLRGPSAEVECYPHQTGPYLISQPIAAGSMVSVHLGVHTGQPNTVVALKRLHPVHAANARFTKMVLDQARLASCVQHPSIVATRGAEVIGRDVYVATDYIAGLSLHALMREACPGTIPERFVAKALADVLRGLHAIHEATDVHGRSLGLVHRDVTPQSILIGVDGRARVLDFGMASASRRLQRTPAGRAKLPYRAPEQLLDDAVDRRADVHAAGVVLWEALTGQPLFHGDSEGATLHMILDGCVTPPSYYGGPISPELDAIVMRAVARRPEDRFQTALEMAEALDAAFARHPATRHDIGRFVAGLGAEAIGEQTQLALELRRRAMPPPAARPNLSLVPSPPSLPPAASKKEKEQSSGRAERRVVLALIFFAGLAGVVVSHAIAHVRLDRIVPAHIHGARR
jgi:serine/threonine-protein kinase